MLPAELIIFSTPPDRFPQGPVNFATIHPKPTRKYGR